MYHHSKQTVGTATEPGYETVRVIFICLLHLWYICRLRSIREIKPTEPYQDYTHFRKSLCGSVVSAQTQKLTQVLSIS